MKIRGITGLASWTGVLFMMLTAVPSQGQSTDDVRERILKEPSLLTVSGRGEVKARPDQAFVRLGVEAQEEGAAAAQESVNAAMQKTIKQIKQLGIPEEAIQTSGLSLAPVYAPPVYTPQQPSREREPGRLIGYRASNTLQVRADDLKLVGKVIDGSIKAGGNRLEGITFGLREDLPQRTRALQLAAREAQTKAQLLADAAGVRLGVIHRIQESGGMIQPQRVTFARAEYASIASTPVEPGELQIEATVTIEYLIEPKTAQSR